MMRALRWHRWRRFALAWRFHASLLLTTGGYYSCVVIIGPDGGAAFGKFNDARALWASCGIVSYEYVVRNHCFCGYGGISVRVVVVNRSVQSATIVGTNQPVAASSAYLFRDIDGLFGVIEEGLRRDPARLDASYDGTYGVPTQFDIDYRANVADEEFGWVIESFVVRQ
jgi:hypothetical protein